MNACGGGSDDTKNSEATPPKSMYEKKAPAMTLKEAESDWENNNGVGPIASLDLPSEIDQELVVKGKEIYEAKCTACHKADKQYIGPAPAGIMKRRTAAWIMNMIMDPESMIKSDPIAKALLIKFNGSPMANQNLTEDEARAILEYFRTL